MLRLKSEAGIGREEGGYKSGGLLLELKSLWRIRMQGTMIQPMPKFLSLFKNFSLVGSETSG